MLKWLTKKVYSSLSEVLGAVYKELESLQPIDTDTVKWTKSLNGMKAHAVVQNSLWQIRCRRRQHLYI